MATVILRGVPRLSLQLSKMVEDIPQTGIMIARRYGPEVMLTEGRNAVDDEFWSAWSEQNAKSDLFRHIFEDNKEPLDGNRRSKGNRRL